MSNVYTLDGNSNRLSASELERPLNRATKRWSHNFRMTHIKMMCIEIQYIIWHGTRYSETLKTQRNENSPPKCKRKYLPPALHLNVYLYPRLLNSLCSSAEQAESSVVTSRHYSTLSHCIQLMCVCVCVDNGLKLSNGWNAVQRK